MGAAECDLLSIRCRPPPSSPPGPAGRQPAAGYASKEDVLCAFGLCEADLSQVQALGEAARRPPEEGEDEGSSDSEGELF